MSLYTDEEIQDFLIFLKAYAAGKFPTDRPPDPPKLVLRLSKEKLIQQCTSKPEILISIYNSDQLDVPTATRVINFYVKNGYLPPPRGVDEVDRLKLIQAFDLDGPEQRANFARCAELIKDFFGYVTTISIFKESVQEVCAVAGNFPVDPGYRIESESGICSHVSLRTDGEPMVCQIYL